MSFLQSIADKAKPFVRRGRKATDLANWKELDKGQWRLTPEIVDKLTEEKHTVLFLLVKESTGIRLSRIANDGQEVSDAKIYSLVEECHKYTTAQAPAPTPTGGW